MMRRMDKSTVLQSQDAESANSLNMEYLKGYRDGLRDRSRELRSQRFSGDGILGALLAIALLTGVGYLGWNYATTGQAVPSTLQLNVPGLKQLPRSGQ